MTGKSMLMKPKARVEFTPERKELFLKHFRERGLHYVCADIVGVSANTVFSHVKSDEAFGEAYKEAKEQHTESVIIAAMELRGIKGVDRPIIGGKDRDVIVTTQKEYSDACLLALARSRRPEFGQKGLDGATADAADGGTGGGVLIVPAAPHTILEWQAQYGQDARGGK